MPLAATGAITFIDTTPAGTSSLGTSPLTSNIAIFSTATLPAGLHNLTATYAGDQTHTAAQTSTFALTISPQQLTAPIAPITVIYGQPIPAISATLKGVLPQDAANLAATFTTTATSLSPAGSYPITATLTGPAAGNYTVASPIATLTINPAPTLVTLGNLAATAATGSSITLTAHVAATTGTPTGAITLLDNGNPISASPLSPTSGDAVFTIAALTAGSHSFTALYNGNANFALSASIPQLITVGAGGPAANPDFTLAPAGATTQTILSGGSAGYTFSAQFQGNMASPIALAATGLPNLATASFNPPTLPPGSTASSFTLTIATPNTTAKKRNATSAPIAWAFLVLPVAMLTLRPRNCRVAARFLFLSSLSIATLLTAGCGARINSAGSQALTARSYTITVTGTATTSTGGILQHATTVTLLLEQPQ